jgi:uncharacterized protein (TIGR02217 family)
MAHLDGLEFPRGVAQGAQVIPERRTDLVRLASGFEEVNQRWAFSRRTFVVGLDTRPADDLAAVAELWEEARGRFHSFRFRDWTDWRSGLPSAPITPLDQPLGQADGVADTFQLAKTYGTVAPYRRVIWCPHPASVRVAVGGVEQLTGWSLSATLGRVGFDAPPAAGPVTAGFAFDVPVRFADDTLALSALYFTADGGLGEVPEVTLAEVRLKG